MPPRRIATRKFVKRRYPTKRIAYPKKSIAYPKRKVYRKTQDRAKVHGGYLDQSISFHHGKPQRINSKFRSRVINSIGAPQETVFKNVGTYSAPATTSQNTAVYFGSPIMYSVADLSQFLPSPFAATRIQMMHCHQSTTITNSSNAQAEMRIYECQSRYDIPWNSATSWPISVLTNGFLSSGDAGQINDPTSTPFQSSDFVATWKILRTRMVKFNPGEQKEFTLSDDYPWNLNGGRYYTDVNTAQILCPGKKGRFLLFQAHGQIMSNNNGTSSSINYSNNIFHAFYITRYTWKAIARNQLTVSTDVSQDAAGVSVNVANLGMTGAFISNTTGLKVTEIDV